MFDINVSENLCLSTQTNSLSEGLEHQLAEFINEHLNTKSVIIDTPQKIREITSDYNYGTDYEVNSYLKKFDEQRRFCIILVHHTRKWMQHILLEQFPKLTACSEPPTGFCAAVGKAFGQFFNIGVAERDRAAKKIYLEFDMAHCL